MDPRAAASFAQEMETLLASFRAGDSADAASDWQPPRHVVRTIAGMDVQGLLSMAAIDGRSLKRVKLRLAEGDKCAVLDESGCDRLEAFCERLSRHSVLSDITTSHSIRGYIEEWVAAVLWSPTNIDSTFSEFLVARAKAEVANYEIWVPLRDIELQDDIHLGGYRLKTIKAERIARLRQRLRDHAPAAVEPDKIEASAETALEKVEGYAAVVVSSTSDLNRAQVNAMEVAERISALLRCLQPINVCCETRSYLEPFARTRVEGADTLSFKDEVLSSVSSVQTSALPFALRLSSDRMARPWEQRLLACIDTLLRASTPTAYQSKLLHALLAYGNAAVARSPGEKLVLTFAALETLLLLNDNEPIQQNLGRRIALFVESMVEPRKAIVATIKTAYALRSKFMHHGERPNHEQFVAINKLLAVAYSVFMKALQLQAELANTKGLGHWIEDRIFEDKTAANTATPTVPTPDEPELRELVCLSISMD